MKNTTRLKPTVGLKILHQSLHCWISRCRISMKAFKCFKRLLMILTMRLWKRYLYQKFTELNCYGGAIEIAMTVAKESDRGNLALAYLHDSKPQGDSRAGLYESTLNIYKLIFNALDEIDAKAEAEISHSDAGANDSRPLAQVRDESYRICFNCEDEVLHYSFYDWFFSKGLESRLLDIQTP